ncbi:alpha/beta hydrolase family esterase [Gloeobacter kilaueensis]|uniref:Poly(3-hydroxybutyrate) depolymerase n=1 Tax=Gloeobacter kilaueensis (strain ATCC BAA-2537 / CCAP 1431/1 / ULC 316 / JS1) TaxID=1183438 RepID=U5QHJ9_GLOK1|nr:PHB depolymerase family esterase [Gloeobacter kilaueensis]AGY57145.1 poly(3-hydroxybutyrate) depolymerase [Gloeobacter kilaueensis JS1]
MVATALGEYVTLTTTWGGIDRSWVQYVPLSINPYFPRPVVLALHGDYGTAQNLITSMAWGEIAEAEPNGFYVLMPNGGAQLLAGYTWNSYVFDGSGVDDMGFVLSLIDTLNTTYPVDRRRVYFFGHSKGAQMCTTIALRYPHLVAALGHIKGGWATDQKPGCDQYFQEYMPVPVWTWRGNLENQVTAGVPRDVQDQHQLEYWTTRLGCNPTPIEQDFLIQGTDQRSGSLTADDGSPVTRACYTQIYTGGSAEYRFTVETEAENDPNHSYQLGTARRFWNDLCKRSNR